MKRNKDKHLATVAIEGNTFSIRASVHALERMSERKIDEYVVTGNVLALGKKLVELKEANTEVIIIDEETNSSVVIGFKKNTIKVITVIDKSNVFVKTGTHIETL